MLNGAPLDAVPVAIHDHPECVFIAGLDASEAFLEQVNPGFALVLLPLKRKEILIVVSSVVDDYIGTKAVPRIAIRPWGQSAPAFLALTCSVVVHVDRDAPVLELVPQSALEVDREAMDMS